MISFIKCFNKHLYKYIYILIVVFLLSPIIAIGQPANEVVIEAFGLSSHPFKNINKDIKNNENIIISICYIDQYPCQQAKLDKEARQFAMEKIKKAKETRKVKNLSSQDQEKLLSNSATADQFSEQHEEELNELRHNFICRYNAKLLGIKKVPAIVFNRRYVIYGETDIAKAYQCFQAFLKKQNEFQEDKDATS